MIDQFINFLTNARGHKLRCSHYMPSPFPEETPLPCVIYCHGNSGCRADANEAAVILLPSNITVFTLDFSGSGLSDGDYVSLGWHERDDLKIVVSYLRSERQISRIGLWGRSMGAVTRHSLLSQTGCVSKPLFGMLILLMMLLRYVFLLYGAEDPSIAGMVLDSAFSNLFDLMMELVDVYKIRLPKFTRKFEGSKQPGMQTKLYLVKISYVIDQQSWNDMHALTQQIMGLNMRCMISYFTHYGHPMEVERVVQLKCPKLVCWYGQKMPSHLSTRCEVWQVVLMCCFYQNVYISAGFGGTSTVKMAVQYMRRVIQKKAKFDIMDLNCLKVAPKTFIPALFGHASEDKFIQPHHSDLIFKSYAGDKNVIKFDGDHNSSRPQFYYDSVSIFFFNVLRPPQISSACSSKLEKYYDLGDLKVSAGMDESLLYEIITGIETESTNVPSSSSAAPRVLMTKPVSELVSEVAPLARLDPMLSRNIRPDSDEQPNLQDKPNGQSDECCSYTSSNRESWGRCSSLGGSDEESSADCMAANNGNQVALRLCLPLTLLMARGILTML
ncbi:Alpha/beta-Hydrolases superfamily protein isoform 1 [Gossypium australe]|uniref:Alpha/beta-Hydrolases superfamily protein isoform 1 n=1 Tax=Gossypium australe TaxID=47621 RepID=A0A5B6X9D0_9ROSI|nr:Alpha/beta-Hydrolases superfamily protein isoform 1 [Gossypium australe]